MNAKIALYYIVWLQIPVFKGSAGPLIGHVAVFKDHFGTDGLGDVLENSEVWKGQIQKEHAVDAMIRLVNENQGEVSNKLFNKPVYFCNIDLNWVKINIKEIWCTTKFF